MPLLVVCNTVLYRFIVQNVVMDKVNLSENNYWWVKAAWPNQNPVWLLLSIVSKVFPGQRQLNLWTKRLSFAERHYFTLNGKKLEQMSVRERERANDNAENACIYCFSYYYTCFFFSSFSLSFSSSYWPDISPPPSSILCVFCFLCDSLWWESRLMMKC